MHKNKTEETAADHLEFNEMFRRNKINCDCHSGWDKNLHVKV